MDFPQCLILPRDRNTPRDATSSERYRKTTMVYLHRIYTKSGDQGQTALGDGTRVSKTHPRIVAYGTVDELNSLLGFIVAQGVDDKLRLQVLHIQNDLFDLGADLCVPDLNEEDEEELTDSARTIRAEKNLRIVEPQITTLEGWIDECVEELQPLNSFILPGGSLVASTLHMARTVCRRAEIETLKLADYENINPQCLIYLNRLSDLLFVLSRRCNHNGRDDILWKPGQNQGAVT